MLGGAASGALLCGTLPWQLDGIDGWISVLRGKNGGSAYAGAGRGHGGLRTAREFATSPLAKSEGEGEEQVECDPQGRSNIG